MRERIEKHQRNFVNLLDAILTTDETGNPLDICEGIESVCRVVQRQSQAGGKIISIGNGGSAVIASHIAVDYWKNGHMAALSFNDGALLTCVSNDFGYEHVFEKPIEFFAHDGDVLFAISSSGKSENILRGARAARLRGCRVITLSGFDSDNPLRSLGTYNFYVPSHEYGAVEVAHQYICHCILDVILQEELEIVPAEVGREEDREEELATAGLPEEPRGPAVLSRRPKRRSRVVTAASPR
jgi:D-sedoheptulose 7-phosphate isomerase